MTIPDSATYSIFGFGDVDDEDLPGFLRIVDELGYTGRVYLDADEDEVDELDDGEGTSIGMLYPPAILDGRELSIVFLDDQASVSVNDTAESLLILVWALHANTLAHMNEWPMFCLGADPAVTYFESADVGNFVVVLGHPQLLTAWDAYVRIFGVDPVVSFTTSDGAGDWDFVTATREIVAEHTVTD